MSVSVTYYSFSPSRADKKKPPVVQELQELLAEFASRAAYDAESEAKDKFRGKVNREFAPKISAARDAIIDYSEERGFYIPKEEWIRATTAKQQVALLYDDPQIEYVLDYGALYKKGVVPPQECAEYILLTQAAPELLDAYKAIKKQYFDVLMSSKPATSSTTDATPKLKDLDTEQVLQYLQELELKRGAVFASIEEGGLEFETRELLLIVFGFNDGPADEFTRDQLIAIFSNIDADKLQELKADVQKANKWTKEEADAHVTRFLSSVKPIALDLRKHPDAILFIDTDGAPATKTAGELLKERAKKYLATLRDRDND